MAHGYLTPLHSYPQQHPHPFFKEGGGGLSLATSWLHERLIVLNPLPIYFRFSHPKKSLNPADADNHTGFVWLPKHANN